MSSTVMPCRCWKALGRQVFITGVCRKQNSWLTAGQTETSLSDDSAGEHGAHCEQTDVALE